MSTKGRAAIYIEPKKPLVVDEVEFADPGPDQVLVKLFSSGVCHSQLHTMQRPARKGQSLPALLGHESTGVVVAKGRDVTHVKEGDHVITTWVDRDSAKTNQPMVTHALNERTQYLARWKDKTVMHSAATWAEYAVAQERVVLPMPKDLPTDVTSIVGCAVMTGAGAIINTLQMRPGESVAIFGAGGIGLCAISAAAVTDAYPIIVVDIDEKKLAFAQRMGATHTVNAKECDAVEEIKKLTAGGTDYAIDAIGLPLTQEQILRSVRPGYSGLNLGGTALLVGITPPDAKAMIDTSLFIGNRSFRRTSGGDCKPDRDFPIFLRWFREGKLKLNELITNRYKLEQINEAVDDLEHGRILGRGILTFN
ncbi:MAG: zinc-binding dehydrogenase [Deltaproteobacteria bacterium]|nr:zinc-binding dehydrogenase [Deltaproteobacteria bacterium]MBM4299124.1 zinc-binding dehydrogenase [Deltaproteobacteria bacterium]